MLAALACAIAWPAEVKPGGLQVDWNKVTRESKTVPTIRVVVNPPLRRGSAIHDRVFTELKRLGADYVPYVHWLLYPKLGVAEFRPPLKLNVFAVGAITFH